MRPETCDFRQTIMHALVSQFDEINVRDLALVGSQFAKLLLVKERDEFINLPLETIAHSFVSRIDWLVFQLWPILDDSVLLELEQSGGPGFLEPVWRHRGGQELFQFDARARLRRRSKCFELGANRPLFAYVRILTSKSCPKEADVNALHFLQCRELQRQNDLIDWRPLEVGQVLWSAVGSRCCIYRFPGTGRGFLIIYICFANPSPRFGRSK